MKIRRKVLVGFLFLGGLLGCKQNDDAVNPENGNGGGATEVGIPNGAAVNKVIGSAGGTITSADGRVTLTIPAGALEKNTEIGIQPITNEAPNGIGAAYRFSPDGTTFAKPASLIVRYDARTASTNSKDAFRIATQGVDGRWYRTSEVIVDTDLHTITTSMPHFSDWTAYQLAMLDQVSFDGGDYVELGASLDLEVMFTSGLMPLGAESNGNEIEIEQIEFNVVGGSGSGTIKRLSGPVEREGGVGEVYPARYTAPSENPPSNPVTVVADVTLKGSKAKFQVVKQILIGKDYFRGTFDGQPFDWQNMVFATLDDVLFIGGWNTNPSQSLNIELHNVNFENPNKTYAYAALVTTEAWAEFSDSYSNTASGWISSNFDCAKNNMRVSPGGVTITQISVVNGVEYVQGRLTGTFYKQTGPCPAQLLSKPVEGEFRIKNAGRNGRQVGGIANFK